MPRVVSVDRERPDPRAMDLAAGVLRAGGLVALPTETVYGLAARAFDAAAVARVFQVKGRPAHHPLIAHVLDEPAGRRLAARWPEAASCLARAFWPGPLTLVVDRAADVPAAIAGGGSSVAVRAPSHPVARAVLAALGEPIAAPSANRYQGLSPTAAAHVVKQLGDAVDLVLDAGDCAVGIESTVVDTRREPVEVLRFGGVDVAALRAALSSGVDATRASARVGDGEHPSPGMDARHYAPRARLVVVPNVEPSARAWGSELSDGARMGVIAHRSRPALGPAAMIRLLPDDPIEYARLLYRTLHELDDARVALILVEEPPADPAWAAVADRLARASMEG